MRNSPSRWQHQLPVSPQPPPPRLAAAAGWARALQHLQQERVDGRVADQLEEEEVLQTLEADAAEGGETQQQLGEAAGLVRVLSLAVLLQGRVHLLTQSLHHLHRRQAFRV